jgi:ribonuclease P protein component
MLRGTRRFRLSGTGAFERVFRSGRRREGEFLQLVSTVAERACGRVGFVIGRKALPLAVDRNRVRRMLRGALRDARPAIDRFDLIVRLKRGAPRAEFPRILREATALLVAVASDKSTR